MAKGNSYVSGKSSRSLRPPTEMSRGRQSIDNALGTFRLHLRTSTLLDEEVIDAFDPNSLAIKIWDQVLFFGYLCEIFTLPLMQAFGFAIIVEAWSAIVLCGCAEVLFFFDLFIKARTGFYSDGNLVRDRRKTRRRYLRSFGFVLDLLALSPFSYMTFISPEGRSKLELVKLVRSIRMVRFVTSLDEFYTAYFVVMKLAKVIIGTVLLSHVIACIRVCFGYNVDGTNEWLPEAPEEGHSQPHVNDLPDPCQ